MGTILLYGLTADDADKRELADNRWDEEEVVQLEGSDRMDGWRIGGGVDFDLLRTATIMPYFIKKKNHFAILQKGFIRKSRWPYGVILSLKIQFSIRTSHYFLRSAYFIFSPHSSITYIFYLIAEAFFKSPFHKNDLFQLCPLGKKTTNRQENCLGIGKKRTSAF